MDRGGGSSLDVSFSNTIRTTLAFRERLRFFCHSRNKYLVIKVMNNIKEKALNYVSKHIDEDYLAYLSSKASAMRCPISLIDPIIADTVYDLLEEFGEDHELPENYWLEFGGIDDILNEL